MCIYIYYIYMRLKQNSHHDGATQTATHRC